MICVFTVCLCLIYVLFCSPHYIVCDAVITALLTSCMFTPTRRKEFIQNLKLWQIVILMYYKNVLCIRIYRSEVFTAAAMKTAF